MGVFREGWSGFLGSRTLSYSLSAVPFDSMTPGMGREVSWLAPLSHHIITIYYINLCAQRVNGVMAGKCFFFDPLLLGLK